MESDAEGHGARVGEIEPLPDTQVLETTDGVGVSKGEKDLLPGSGAVTPGLRVSAVVALTLRDVHAVVVMLRVAEGEVEEEAQELTLGVICGEDDCAGELERVSLGEAVAVQDGRASKPGSKHCEQPVQGIGEVRLTVGQKLPMGQVRHVALEGEPVALLKVPAGQGVGLVELRGQNDPAGQRMGMPVEQ